jgi:type II secretory pathway component PulJ
MNSNTAITTANYRVANAGRQGLSMIEVIVMASVTSMMLVMVTSWIHQTMKQSARFRTERREHLAVSQLGQHFRKHVWRSNAAELAGLKVVSLTTPTGDRFTYRHQDQQIHFVHKDVSGELQALDRFALPITSNVIFEQASESRVALTISTLDAAETSDRNPRIYQVIKPTLGRWLPETTSLLLDSKTESTLNGKELLE